MRQSLKNALVSLKVNGNWDHITKQIGMFSYTGLSEKQCLLLIEKYHIYLLKNGRISMVNLCLFLWLINIKFLKAGINSKNVDYIAKAIKDAIETYP